MTISKTEDKVDISSEEKYVKQSTKEWVQI